MENTTGLIDLFGKEFIIPHYQRGYRWEAQEVQELLDDIWNFEKTSNKGQFYCLQPIVLLKVGDNTYSVLDGQQRLTTLYLILIYLEERSKDLGYNKKLFTLNYETRKDCKDFLEKRKFVYGIDESNIDYMHISKAYAAITEWFDDSKHAGAKMKLVPILMDKNDKGNRNVRFIWYEPKDKVNPIDVFIRLNVGKIQLTDAELVKALLLQSDKYAIDELKFLEPTLLSIASEWDSIEYRLQDEEFWYFLSNHTNEKPTHIEFIFDLIADKYQKKYFETKPLKHSTFLVLSAYLQDLIDNGAHSRIEAIENIWHQVAEYFEYFKNWFQDRTLFHYIGYLIASRNSQIIDILIERSKNLSKRQFKKYLEQEIGNYVKISKTRSDLQGNLISLNVGDLNYENGDNHSDDKVEIHRILLLHNVYTTLKSDKEKARFPFNLYKHTKKTEKWSLEHIHARNSENITKKEHKITWLEDHIKSLENQNNTVFHDLVKEMVALRNDSEIEQENFDRVVAAVYTSINAQAEIDEHNIHSISNLCLVDSFTNSLLNNSVFDVKRETIRRRELEGHFIPLCTRNVFLKVYTAYSANNAYWTKNDRTGYLNSVQDTYNYFITSIHKN